MGRPLKHASSLLCLAVLALSAAHFPGASATDLACDGHAATARQLLQQSNATTSDNATECCAALAAIGFSSTLPVVVINTAGKPIPHKVDTRVQVCTCSAGGGIDDYSGAATAAGRGTSSSNNTKKSYKLELLTDDGGGKRSFPLLGMPEDADWILYGPELDKTLGMRNYLAYNLARSAGRYASRTVYCEVFLVDDGAPLSNAHYNGVYIAEEKIKRVSLRWWGRNRKGQARCRHLPCLALQYPKHQLLISQSLIFGCAGQE